MPPRDDISEDSMEDQVSELESQEQSMRLDRQQTGVKRTIDVETILKQAADGLDDESIASSTY